MSEQGPKSGQGEKSSVTLAVFGVAVLVNLVLSVILIDQVVRTRDEVRRLSAELPSKQDVAMLRPIRVEQILANCERCHSNRRFAGLANMTEAEKLTTIQRMRSHPGAEIAGSEVDDIEAALVVFRCLACHNEGVVSQIGLMPRQERVRFLRTKIAMPDSGFRVDQLGELTAAFDLLTGAGPAR